MQSAWSDGLSSNDMSAPIDTRPICITQRYLVLTRAQVAMDVKSVRDTARPHRTTRAYVLAERSVPCLQRQALA